jgi:hypothetical protein
VGDAAEQLDEAARDAADAEALYRLIETELTRSTTTGVRMASREVGCG